MAPQGGNPFTQFTGTDAPDTASFNSMMSSLMEDASTRVAPPFVTSDTPTTSTSNVAATSEASVQQVSSTFSTLLSSSTTLRSSLASTITPTSVPSSATARTSTTSTITNAASESSASITKDDCHSVSCSPGLKAAVAVPVVVGVLAIAALLLFLARRRKREESVPVSKSEKPKKKWTRHLKIFSFDNELVGGRLSSNHSVRSGDSNHHLNDARQQADNPSVHSIEEAAPPYATSHTHQPSMTQTGGGLAAGALGASAIPRSTSRASAPPPYGHTTTAPQPASDAPVGATENTNPFSDPPNTNPTILVDGSSPFQDPSDDEASLHSRPGFSRNSSMRTGLGADDASVLNGSDAGSIREAQVGRHVSVTSVGRTIQNVRSSQSPANSATNSATNVRTE